MAGKQILLRVDENLHRRAKVEVAKRGTTLTAVLRDCLVAFVGDKPARKTKQKENSNRAIG
jgi:hypothetical protein